ncbi:uncharacterized protein [Haliotis asinina]|uniref:uncharacterized protein n=1 Tax=Haliotis asinina TaxID=109174 RepID=UPI003531F3D8
MFMLELQNMIESSTLRGLSVGQEFMEILLLLYADDLCLVDDSVIGLQRKIDILDSFCNKWGLQVNLDKTEVMVFRNGGILRHYEKWFFSGSQIKVTTYYNYLGILFSNRLSWSKCVDTLAVKGNKALFFIKKLLFMLPGLPVNIAFKLFDIKIKPVLLYGAEVWGFQRYPVLESLHSNFCKFVLGVSKYNSGNAVLAECGRHRLYIDYHVKCVKYWCKLLRMDNSRYPRQCYLLMKQLDESGRTTWASGLRQLLSSFGFGDVWWFQDIGDMDRFLMLFKQRICECNVQVMFDNISTSYRLKHYLQLKSCFDTEYYVMNIRNWELRRCFCLLRLDELPIQTTIGRRYGIDKRLCFCKYCNDKIVEDVMHFIFVCPMYNLVRARYIPSLFSDNPTAYSYTQLVCSKDHQTILNVAKYVKHCLTLRSA